jgi:hypothetical protein
MTHSQPCPRKDSTPPGSPSPVHSDHGCLGSHCRLAAWLPSLSLSPLLERLTSPTLPAEGLAGVLTLSKFASAQAPPCRETGFL